MGSNERKRRSNRHQVIAVTVFFVLIVTALFAYSYSLSTSELVSVSFKNPDGSHSESFSLEQARSRAEQEKGLMYRKEMPADQGMIFAYPSMSVKEFWMKNTYIPLDMLFVDNTGKVVGILNDVPVLNEERRSVSKPSQFVIELNAGAAAKGNIKEGAVAEYSPRDWFERGR